jgi:hypothetical protein
MRKQEQLENDAIRKAMSDAANRERRVRPFNLSGRGHEPRVTLDVRLAAILRGLDIPHVRISGYGPKKFYPVRVLKSAATYLKRRFGWPPVVVSGSNAYRGERS